MNLITKTTADVWHDATGRELVRLGKGCNEAVVMPSGCDENTLRALATACMQAADAMAEARKVA